MHGVRENEGLSACNAGPCTAAPRFRGVTCSLGRLLDGESICTDRPGSSGCHKTRREVAESKVEMGAAFRNAGGSIPKVTLRVFTVTEDLPLADEWTRGEYESRE